MSDLEEVCIFVCSALGELGILGPDSGVRRLIFTVYIASMCGFYVYMCFCCEFFCI
jgi:hypothetical protein